MLGNQPNWGLLNKRPQNLTGNIVMILEIKNLIWFRFYTRPTCLVCRSCLNSSPELELHTLPCQPPDSGSYRSGEVVLPRLAVRLEYQIPSTSQYQTWPTKSLTDNFLRWPTPLIRKDKKETEKKVLLWYHVKYRENGAIFNFFINPKRRAICRCTNNLYKGNKIRKFMNISIYDYAVIVLCIL